MAAAGGLLFHFTGVSVAAARSLAVVCTWISVLLAYLVARQYRSRTFAAWSAFLAAANALGFFFGRLALLEPAFVMFLLLAIYLAGKIRRGNYALAVAVAVVFTIATLTKNTGPFILPAVLYPIWAANRKTDRNSAWKLVAVAGGTALILLAVAKLICFHHYPADAGVILSMRPLWQLENSPLRMLRFFFRGTWIDPVLFPLAVAALIGALTRLRFLWQDTLFATAFLWEAGYAAFIIYHYDGPPRYFVTLIVPTIWLALIFTEWLWQQHRRSAIVVTACIAISVAWNLASIGNYLVHPSYRLMDASQKIKLLILSQQKAGATPNHLLIGRGADEISLLSGGFPTMDSDGAMLLQQKLDIYHPGWFMAWNNDPPLRASIVAKNRRMVERAHFGDLDRYRHAGITLYQLFPKQSP